jgi:restriction system protein
MRDESSVPGYVSWEERVVHSSRGLPSYEISIAHAHLHKAQVIRDRLLANARMKARMKAEAWEETWQRQKALSDKKAAVAQKKEEAARLTREASEAISLLENLLKQAASSRHAIDWHAMKADFGEPQPVTETHPEPLASDHEYRIELGFMDRLLKSRREGKEVEARDCFERDHRQWEARMAEANRRYEEQTSEWNRKRTEYEDRISEFEKAFRDRDPGAVRDYFSMVLEGAQYPDFLSTDYELVYRPESRILLVDFLLPAPESLPSIKEVTYVQSRDELTEKPLPKKTADVLFDSVVYQICLRSVHVLFSADTAGAVESIVFNGWVESLDRATGKAVKPCILSVQVGRDELEGIDLANVDPRACFKALKGVGSSKLHGLAPIAPVLQFDREDSRFVDGREVVGDVDQETNLAAMDWEEFEHLIRELFEAEFASKGGEVMITQASRDRGVDAVAFDPDPITGGKIVIQAKRYSNTVVVSAVRDLY